ncbi:hypothetical protein FDH34_gp049 [Serratia phage BF]|uniref:Uncharacterized protein n=2 Tax=Eneladusvirus BF TaxID=2560751 RepID=A0A7L8ZMX6_9CAUD|nr:hypothetical protein FDH34_gp049 [Serratia phage BF]AQW88574.1 hypothetical protein BF_0049 [Serratia phage BF]QOI71532.1 hypothetical protein pEaSNUABM47_00048 [Erwinia phage pEa_SNUABM_47]
MTRAELIQSSTMYRLLGAYKIFKEKEKKYKGKLYNFTLYDYNDSGYDLECSHHGLYIWPNGEDRDDNQIFSIEYLKDDQWWVQSLLNDYEFSITPREAVEINVGDHLDLDKSNLYVYNHQDEEELFEEYPEEWFFQQLTVQDIIPFEQFKEEVKFCKKILSHGIDEYDRIFIFNLEKFNINLLEGFKEI